MANWNDYKKPSDKEIEDAHKLADKLSEPDPEPEVRLVRGGQKRQASRSANRPPFNGCSKEESDLIRKFLALRFAGYTQREAFEEAEVNPSKANSMMHRHKDAVEEAKQELLQSCLNEYHANLWMLRSALSEMGPRAVRTLGAVMDDKGASAHVRMKAAVSILKLINIDGGVTNGKDPGTADFLVTLRDNRSGKESNSVIIDAERVEVIDEDEDECSSGVC